MRGSIGFDVRGLAVCAVAIAAAALTGAPAYAQDSAFQDFFSRVCGNPTVGSELENRCNESVAGGGAPGDLSADSESSLNAGQLTSVTETLVSKAQSRQRRIQSRLEELRSDAEAPPVSAGWTPDFKPSLLINGRAHFFEQGLGERERELEGAAYSVQVGADTRFRDDLVFGALFSYDRSDAEFGRDQAGVAFTPPANDGEIDTNSYVLTLFGSWSPTPRSWIDVSVGAGYDDHRFERNGVFQESSRTVATTDLRTSGETDGYQVNLAVGAGYDIEYKAFSVAPYVRVSWVHSEIDGYTEDDQNGSGLSVQVDDIERDSVITSLGLRASYAFSTPAGVVIPQIRYEFAREWKRDAQDLSFRFVQDPSQTVFGTRGDDPDRNYNHGGLGVLWVLPNGWMPFVDYQTTFQRDDWEADTVTVGLRREL